MQRLQKIAITLVALLLLAGCSATQKGDKLAFARNALAIAYTGVTSANVTFSTLVAAGVIDNLKAEEVSIALTKAGAALESATRALDNEKDPESVLEFVNLANKILLEILPLLEEGSQTMRTQAIHNAL